MVYIFYSHLRIYSINIYLLLFAFALAFHYLFYPSITSGMWDVKDVRGEYSKQGYQFPDTWQFSNDIDSMLNVDFWE